MVLKLLVNAVLQLLLYLVLLLLVHMLLNQLEMWFSNSHECGALTAGEFSFPSAILELLEMWFSNFS